MNNVTRDAIDRETAKSEADWGRRELEADLFTFLTRKYVQRADDRQKAMGLQYTEAETHDLAHEIAGFILRRY